MPIYDVCHIFFYQFRRENRVKKIRLVILSCVSISIILGVFLLSNALGLLHFPLANQQTSQWRLVVDGLVRQPLNLTFDELVKMPLETVNAQLYCVGNPTTPLVEGNWSGVRLGLLLETAGVSGKAIKVAFYASDGYKTDLTISQALNDNIIVAFRRDDSLLSERLRLVVPGKWGYKWISGLTHIQLVDYDFLGTWESRGYSDEG